MQFEAKHLRGSAPSRLANPAVTIALPPGYILHHRRPQQSIDPGLITFALITQPSDHVCIKPDRELMLDRPVERIRNSVFPEAVLERGDVRVVDLRVWLGSQGRHLPALLRS